MKAPTELDEHRCFVAVLDELKSRQMTADAVKVGYIEVTGLRYPPPPKRDADGEPIDPHDDDLTYASAG